MDENYHEFYNEQYKSDQYSNENVANKHPYYKTLIKYVNIYRPKCDELQNSGEFKCLEVGSGRGAFQDIVDDYTGIDISESLSQNYHKPFYCGSATQLPFEDNHFDLIWSYAVLEHVPDPEKALNEMLRVIKPNGHIILSPAWHCRKWAANGYQVRPYTDFKLCGKIYKFMIPIFDSTIIRGFAMLFKRIFYLISYLNNKPTKFYYEKLNANYDVFWQSDSDACNSMDQYSAILWFESRGCRCVSHPAKLLKFFIRNTTIDIEVKK